VKVVLTDQVFPTTDVERQILKEIGADLVVLKDSSPESIGRNASDADGLLNTYAPIDRATMEALLRCKVIARYGIGVDNIDLDAARAAGITVTNVPDYCIDEVADHTIALLLVILRKIVRANALVGRGGWGIAELQPIHRLSALTLGLVGFGHIGREVAARARALKLDVIVYDPYVDRSAFQDADVEPAEDLDELFAASDVVSIHVPLVESTRGLIDAAAIAKMQKGAVLINTSRGPIVETKAVLDGLSDRQLAGAALDVFDAEPPDATSFSGVDTLIATPHMAFYSTESIRESQTKAARCVASVLQGRAPPYRVS
jgi:D-3-phosphoglycerate dehydrogenase